MSVTSGWIESMWTYPVKGLSPQWLDRVTLRAGRGFPNDRKWALARRDGAYREEIVRPLRKTEFHVLVRDAQLAGVRTFLDDDDRLTLWVQEHVVLDGVDLCDPAGREAVSVFFGRLLDLPRSSFPVIARQKGRRFTDIAPSSDEKMNAISLINLASVRDLAERAGVEAINPLRFRANLYIDGLPPHSELDMIGHTICIGDARLEVIARTGRCAATTVNPIDAQRDLPIPRLLVEHYGHANMGCYAVVRHGGAVQSRQPLRIHDVTDVPA
ncbi:MAG: MOSC domain-containing protein [Propioniciclava sp.]|uniref:MOSC domain-containing protein n=1 Tax=Propioniciclava sp. TaxID=2038686 RepID=UPI0039E6344A